MAEFDAEILATALQVLDHGKKHGVMVATAESCTGGLIGGALTSLSGSSSVYDRGIISYSNEAKMQLLNVPDQILDSYGAVSKQTAIAMVHGLFQCSAADIGVSVTGVAGPGGGSDDKPVGLVYIGHGKRSGEIIAERCLFDGDRSSIRRQTILRALQVLVERIIA